MARLKNGLYINGIMIKGVAMGEDFIQTLERPLEMKENIVNESRLEHGRRIVLINKVKERSINLTFIISGNTKVEHDARLKELLKHLYEGNVKIFIVKPTDVRYVIEYNLVYTGKSVNYARSYSGCDSKLTCGFEENYPVEDVENEWGRKKVDILNYANIQQGNS